MSTRDVMAMGPLTPEEIRERDLAEQRDTDVDAICAREVNLPKNKGKDLSKYRCANIIRKNRSKEEIDEIISKWKNDNKGTVDTEKSYLDEFDENGNLIGELSLEERKIAPSYIFRDGWGTQKAGKFSANKYRKKRTSKRMGKKSMRKGKHGGKKTTKRRKSNRRK